LRVAPPVVVEASRPIVACVMHTLAARSAAALLLRNPAIDPRFPDTSDLDFIAVADIEKFRSERLQCDAPGGTSRMVDVAWLPRAWFDAPEATAALGWVPHRLLTSDVVFDSGLNIGAYLEQVRRHMYYPAVQQKRLATFLDTGFQTVREIGITWDFPALALFWLHMSHAGCLGAALDGMRRLCPNVYTRPFDYVDDLEDRIGGGVRTAWVEALRLDVDLESLVARLRRVHDTVANKFPEPEWPDTIGDGTRFEYRYWIARTELDWRIDVAREMARCHEPAGAIFYLRFCAYAIARLPMVHARARNGEDDVSFLRPEKAIRPELQRLVPEIVDDLSIVLAGTRDLDRAAVTSSLSSLYAFRDLVLEWLRDCEAPVPAQKTWAPHEPTVFHADRTEARCRN
jgi:hypothetical protein